MSNPRNSGVAADHLRSFVERIERLREEIKALNVDVSEVYKEAKSAGFNVKVMKALIAERAKNPQEIEEFGQLLDLYRAAVGGTLPATHAGAREAGE